MYSPQSLWTAAHEDLPVTFVVINNREYNVLKNFMRAQPHYVSVRTGQFIGMDIATPPVDFPSLARSMGVPARRLGSAAEIHDAVREGLASCRPNLIEIVVGTE
jgi:benzoylformate decarboxylase